MRPGALQYLLRNPAYRGVTRHHDKRYEDTHPAIIDLDLWDPVQAKLDSAAASGRERSPKSARGALDGRIFDDQDHPMLTVHTNRGVRRYRYYVSRAAVSDEGRPGSLPRVSIGLLEGFLTVQLGGRLSRSWRPDSDETDRVMGAIVKLTVGEDRIEAVLSAQSLTPHAAAAAQPTNDSSAVVVRIPFEMRRRHGSLVLQQAGAPSPAGKIDRVLVRAVVLARRWAMDLESGATPSIKALARREGLCNHYTTRVLRLAYLAPSITTEILAGRQPVGLTLSALTKKPLPLDWTAQDALIARLA
jgi:hypothetical protein